MPGSARKVPPGTTSHFSSKCFSPPSSIHLPFEPPTLPDIQGQIPPTSPICRETPSPVLALPHPLFLEHAWTPVGPQLKSASRCSSETGAKILSLFLFVSAVETLPRDPPPPDPRPEVEEPRAVAWSQRTSSCGATVA
ncbi:hypothetical protein PAAG_12331 [Paracoccidioides lutzii Pb01]|uniref:Uncharacterized protein n=1 Tax=Paracoccidioides lutzii (strain ATCC MYA-826 / Pb01) TaxID=502779 RepID=A0A0A2VJD6_PARBA|nr:hypothetical protein PAAG_12331 [Paracoccidioides lutzii Pb01]KGQ01019.1 hypothetical protein PAAG_12331 [Paracoccidioides lutzii Pb01]